MSKREVKSIEGFEKELLSETERIELFISKYWLKIAVAAVIIVAICTGVYAYTKKNADAVAAKQQQLAAAEGEALSKLIAENGNVPGVDMARIRRAAELVEAKDFKAAAAMLRTVLDNPAADVQLRQVAALELGGALEQNKEIDEAIKVFSAAVDENSFSAGIKAQAGCQAARLLISKDNAAAAKALLQRIIARKGSVVDDMGFASWVSQCEQMLTALENGDFKVAGIKK